MDDPMLNLLNLVPFWSVHGYSCDKFVESGLKLIDEHKDLSEVPRIQRRALTKPLEMYAKSSLSRNDAVIKAYQSGGYTLKEVGDFFGLGYSMVSKIVRDSKFKT